MYDYLILANGPFLSKKLIKEALANKRIVVLDGAVNKLRNYNIIPHIILGDFDSVSTDAKKYWGIERKSSDNSFCGLSYTGRNGVEIILAPDQDLTDLVKAIRYCDTKNAKSITIICATGGREDHHEAMRIALKTEYKPNRNIVVHSCYQSLRYAVNETIKISGKIGDYCGVIVTTETGYCHSIGLEYELNKHKISTSNRLKSSSAILKVFGEALIIMPPQLAAQRNKNY